MAGATANKFDGMTWTLGTSGFTSEVLSADWSGISTESFETSHALTAAAGAGKIANATYLFSDITDGGAITLTFNFDPDQLPPVAGVVETGTLLFRKIAADASAASWAASVGMTDWGFSGDLKGKWTATGTWKVTGNITLVAAA